MTFGQVKTTDNSPVQTRYVWGAGALFVILLAALVHVVKGQVEQAQFRQTQLLATQAALAGCAAHQSGVMRRQCTAQLTAGLVPGIEQSVGQELHSPIQTERPDLMVVQGLPNGLVGSTELYRGNLTETAFNPR